jgi:hypothetical protein
MIPGLDLANALLTLIGGLLVIVWWSIRSWMSKIDVKLDRMELRQTAIEKDCVTWPELEKVTLRLSEYDRRITIIETTCKQEHGN